MTRKEFYNTKAWKRNRQAYAISKNCLCERCKRPVYVSGVTDYLTKDKRLKYVVHHKTYLNDANFNNDIVALDWNNLELLCIDCHNDEHNPATSTRAGLMFDDKGNLIQKPNIKRAY